MYKKIEVKKKQLKLNTRLIVSYVKKKKIKFITIIYIFN